MAKISVFGMNAAFQLGFKRIADVRGMTSVVSLFENSMILSGIYLQIRPGNTAYVGKTNNMPARFENHLARGTVIEELAFMPVLVKHIDEKEKQIIALAEKKGIPLENLALREQKPAREKTLSDLITEEEIQEWLAEEQKAKPTLLWYQTYQAMHPGLRHQFDLARAHPVWGQIFPLARKFVLSVIPKPEDTREDFWSATAYTKKTEEVFSSVIRIHAGSATLISLGSFRFSPFAPWGWVEIAKEDLLKTGFTRQRLLTDLPFARITEKDNTIQIGAGLMHLNYVIETLKIALRRTTLTQMKGGLLQRGNPALECLLAN